MKDIVQLYKIGKELGLSHKEINRTLFFKNRHSLVIVLIMIVILSVFALVFWNIMLIFYAKSQEPVYAQGTYYSSIGIKDFKNKNKLIYYTKGGV